MKTSTVLGLVKAHLRDGGYMQSHERYVCYALEWLYYHAKTIGDVDRTRVKRMVRHHLEGSRPLEQWLDLNHCIMTTNTPSYKKRIMATRKAWLDHLIEHYRKQGD